MASFLRVQIQCIQSLSFGPSQFLYRRGLKFECLCGINFLSGSVSFFRNFTVFFFML